MGYKQYCKNYENIENYEKAKKDNFIGWECHHRLETHTPDGKRREVDISCKELQALGMYYHRPAEELIFLTISEHSSFNKGKKRSDEARKRMSEAKKGKYIGENHPNYGKHFSEETRKRMSESHKGKPSPNKGKHHSEETRKRMSSTRKGENNPAFGKHWYNNSKIEIMAKECPDGFVPGRLR